MAEPDSTSPPPGLMKRAAIGLVQFMVFLALVLFVPAWSLTWWQGWLFWFVFGAACLVLSLYFLKHDPALVARRMNVGPTAERETQQKVIQWIASVLLIALFMVPAFDHLFGWSSAPLAIVFAGDGLVIVGFYLMFLAMRANSYASSTIEIGGGQTVISTGAYAVVRHPMYSGAALMFLGVPLALGSWWGLVPAAFVVPLLAWRLTSEEAYLVRNLTGYEAYRAKVRWRLAPLIW